ncbi:hypothetical protein D5018_17710 [Parashewanella curva]|uniref:Death domain-containing protein n=1 Tax=Parashewanella curva TaxID=2338552 RepID=A0A3L8PSW6_9GAMM|nr:hypothetical protein [Parashewanella curva]RLV58344.1 hypothetical protein D5018_17710 [Parashewanella curva]
MECIVRDLVNRAYVFGLHLGINGTELKKIEKSSDHETMLSRVLEKFFTQPKASITKIVDAMKTADQIVLAHNFRPTLIRFMETSGNEPQHTHAESIATANETSLREVTVLKDEYTRLKHQHALLQRRFNEVETSRDQLQRQIYAKDDQIRNLTAKVSQYESYYVAHNQVSSSQTGRLTHSSHRTIPSTRASSPAVTSTSVEGEFKFHDIPTNVLCLATLEIQHRWQTVGNLLGLKPYQISGIKSRDSDEGVRNMHMLNDAQKANPYLVVS